MNTLKLYCTLEDINDYIRTKVDEKYKNDTFIPIKAEINELDMSVELTLVSPTATDNHNGNRYRVCNCESSNPVFATGLCTLDDIIMPNAVEGIGNAKCPHCGESYYTEEYSTSTSVYYPLIYKDGVNINQDRNQTTTHCRCLNCGKGFDI